MGEALAIGAARFMGEKVVDLLQLEEKLKVVTGIEGKMKKLKELSTIVDAVIQDAESRPFTDDPVKDLLRKLKYLAYDLEDAVDFYDTRILWKQISKDPFRPVRDFFSSNNQVVFKFRIGGMIKAITESLESILLQKSFLLNLSQSSIRMSEPNLRRETHSYNSLVIIGREMEKQMIVDMLTDDDDESNNGTLKVFAIVGMGGLGKTTLAQLVFNDERVKVHFASSRMWKVVGAEFDPTKILKSVLQLATGAPVYISETDLVRQKLEESLYGKRFLLVLDDVWNEDASNWGIVKAALTCGARGSKILVTTRSLRVSSIMGSFKTHCIQQLSRDDCLSLFLQFALGDETVDQNLMEIGGKIVEKCGGVPLAAISLGGMLHCTRDELSWSSVLNSEIWQLRDGEQKMLAVLKWSYDTLPLRSKKCFAFGSLFPKDFTMEKDELIKLWMANGFVHSERNFEAEAVGNGVFDDLVTRSFFLLAPSNERHFGVDGHATLCTMHDLMHDLARSVSANVYWNSEEDSVEDIGNRTYHLNLHQRWEIMSNINQAIGALGKKPVYLRTLILSHCDLHQNCNELEIVLSKLKFLRVLDLSFNYIRKVPTSIGNLIHLRYLNLSENNIEFLPDSITLLHNLQYLDCDYDRLTRMPCGLSRLTNLRSLPVFVATGRTGTCSITELEDLKLQGEMTIKFFRNFTNYTCGGRKILKNKHLNELSLEFYCSDCNNKDMLDDLCPNISLKKLTILNYRSRQFPTWLIELQLPNLVEVSVVRCHDCEIIPPFGNLQFLKKLELRSMNGITQMGVEFHGYGGFPSLQQLCVRGMINLEEWSESHGTDLLFPSLQRLSICLCPKLKCMPWLPKIQSLELNDCSMSLLPCVGRLTSLSVLEVNYMSGISLPSGCIRNLTSLTELHFAGCRQLKTHILDEMQHLKKIRSLTIHLCGNLASFPLKVGHLSSLCLLQLTGCPSITLKPKILVEILNSLHQFRIEICSKKVNLRGQLQHLHTLKELFITGSYDISTLACCVNDYKTAKLIFCCCDEIESLMTGEPTSSVLDHLYLFRISNLMALPDWLQHLKALRSLKIEDCPRLETVPRGLKNLPNLETLRFIDSPQPTKRYKMVPGKDWPIISHLPQFHIL